jgi:hypothetical protein
MRYLLDDVARSLAEPMTRKRAIRVLGGAFATAVVPSLARTGTAHAQDMRRAGLDYCGAGTTPCPAAPNCCDPGWYCADKPTHACCPNGNEYCVLPSGDATCCDAGNHCAPGIGCCGKKAFCGIDPCCEHGGSECVCPRGEICHKGSCEACPHGKHKCGDKKCCDPHTEKCCANTCCKKDQGCCGELCCDKGQKCCDGQICCFKNEECCGGECCDKHHKCSVDSQGHQVCCPGIRTAHPAPGKSVCCPPGYVVDPTGSGCCSEQQPHCGCVPACGTGTFCFSGTCVSLPPGA